MRFLVGRRTITEEVTNRSKEVVMPPPLPPRPPFLFLRPFQIAVGVLFGWMLRSRHDRAASPQP
jgi:hypothetical protein